MRDRREVLKLLAGGAAITAGTSIITTTAAFADGGTESLRPDCSTVSAVTWSSTSTNNRLDVLLAFTPTTGCASGWTPSQQFAVRVSPIDLAAAHLGTQVATNGNWSAFLPFTGLTAIQILRASGGGGNIPTGNVTITVDIIVRRVCTKATNPAVRSWCCSRYSKTAVYVREGGGGVDIWGSETGGDFGAGSTNVSTDAGCAAP